MGKRKAIKKYFAWKPKWILWVALPLIVIGFNADASSQYYFLAAAGALLARYIAVESGRPSDKQMDNWLAEDMRSIEARALVKSGLVRENLVRDAVVVFGPRFRNAGGAKFGFRKGNDAKARYTPVDISVLNFTEHQLVAYQCSLDFMTGDPRKECVDEYFYNDIVSVSTKAESQSFSIGELDRDLLSRVKGLRNEAKQTGVLQVNDAQTFVLSSSAGTSIRVLLNAPVVINKLGGGTIATEDSEKAVQAVRSMVREKKAGALPIRSAMA